MFVAPVSGTYGVELSFLFHSIPTPDGIQRVPWSRKLGSEPRKWTDDVRTYTLRVIALRQATSEDRERAGLFQKLEQAVKLTRLETMDGLRQALEVFRDAGAGWRSVGDVALETETLEALAGLAGMFAPFMPESAAARERLAELYAQLGLQEDEARNWHILATNYYQGGRLAQAKQAVGRALELATTLHLRWTGALCQNWLARLEFELGNYGRSRELAQRARELAAEIADGPLEALAILDLARLDELAGDLDAAIARNRRALELASGDAAATSTIIRSLGFLHLRRGELQEAAARFDARLELARRYVQRDDEALTRVGLGDVSLARGDREQARRLYENAATALQKYSQQFRCVAVQRLGRMDLDDGRLAEARAHFQTMLDIAARFAYEPCEAQGRAGLADLAARGGDLETADAEAQRVVALTERFRSAAVSLESRTLGFDALAPAYERAIDIAMRRAERGDAASIAHALTLNEQALARGLLDRVLEARLESIARVPAPLAAAYQQARERWRARLAELQVAMRSRPNAPETKALADETRALEVQLRDLETQINGADAKQATFVRPQPLSLDAIQKLLDNDTLMLEYGLGDARSYLWVVSSRDIRAFTLVGRAEIEAVARRVHEGLARSPAVSGSARRADEEDLRALTRLLIEPAGPQLDAKRLVLVVSGALSLIPFGALPQPGPAVHPLPMIAKHEIVQVPSATILGAMRTLTAGRARPTRTAAIFADPIFDAQDPRVQPRAQSASVRGGTPPDPARLRGVALTRLPFSRGEAEAIAKLAPRNVITLLGPDATRERALARALFDYRFIHFATHGIVNQDVPSLSSLVLSLVDRAGRARDGFVMVPDIYDMTLNADVVVLSGCQTALGKQIRGEGPIGLARAFMYAGVPRVVASLWPVDDLATAELMKRFYRGMLVDRLAPAAALRRAQQQLAASRRWASPYFWAPFVLQGDWR
jgi:CHAT domain-containing protein